MATKNFETLTKQKKIFFTIARDNAEYLKDIIPSEDLFKKLHENGFDIFTFLERKWCCSIAHPPESWLRGEDNIAILHLKNYDDWWKNVGKKTRNVVRKAEKAGVKTDVVKPDDRFAGGVWRIFNETPVRQERGFPHYGISLETVKKYLFSLPNSTYIGAYFHNELVGFIHLVHGDKLTIISQILSMQKHLDKSLNNALIAKAIEFCSENHIEWIMYGRMGNHPTLDNFKESNGFTRLQLTRYYVPLTWKGRLAIRLRLYRELKDTLPPSMKNALFPFYNWMSRTRAKLKPTLKRNMIT
jgi:hypothetical protein